MSDDSGREPLVDDVVGGSGQYTENPRQVDHRWTFANLVHVQDGGAQPLAGASDIRKGVGGPGCSETVFDLTG
jgi:hypothetical protein